MIVGGIAVIVATHEVTWARANESGKNELVNLSCGRVCSGPPTERYLHVASLGVWLLTQYDTANASSDAVLSVE